MDICNCLTVTKLLELFYERVLQNIIQEVFRIEKVLKKEEIKLHAKRK